jgi:hypothetical protein
VDATALKTLMLAQADGSPIRVAYDAGDSECATELNRLTIPAFVPRRSLVSILATYRLLAAVDSVVLHRLTPAGAEASAALFALCSTLRWVVLLQADSLRTPIADAKAGCAALAPFSSPSQTAEQLEALVGAAATGLISVVQAATGDLDYTVTAEQVAATRTI